MPNVLHWFADRWQGLMNNPTAIRDSRIQMRGRKGTTVISIYLVLMISIVLYFYQTMVLRGGATDPAGLQDLLRNLYRLIMGALGATVCLVPTMMGAFSVVMERSRRTLELITLAPIRPHEYLVGKLVSSTRFTSVLLLAGLPALAITLAIGGATPLDLITTIILYVSQAITFASVGLYVSSFLRNPILSIVFSGMGIFCLNWIGLGVRYSENTGWWHALTYLSPFATMESGTGLLMPFGPIGIPGWIAGLGVNALVTLIFLSQAAPGIDPTDATLVRRSRLVQLGLTVTGTLAMLVMGAQSFGQSDYPLNSPNNGIGIVASVFGGIIGLFMVLGARGDDDHARYRADQKFNIREILTGQASTLYAYGLLHYGIVVAGLLVGALAGWLPTPHIGPLLYGFAFITMMRGIVEFVSKRTESVKSARALSLVWIAGMVLVPSVLVGLMSTSGDSADRLLALHPVLALDPRVPWASFGWGMLFLLVGYLFKTARVKSQKLPAHITTVDISGETPIIRTDFLSPIRTEDGDEQHLAN